MKKKYSSFLLCGGENPWIKNQDNTQNLVCFKVFSGGAKRGRIKRAAVRDRDGGLRIIRQEQRSCWDDGPSWGPQKRLSQFRLDLLCFLDHPPSSVCYSLSISLYFSIFPSISLYFSLFLPFCLLTHFFSNGVSSIFIRRVRGGNGCKVGDDNGSL